MISAVRQIAKKIVLLILGHLNLRLRRRHYGVKFVVLLRGRIGLGLLMRQEEPEVLRVLKWLLAERQGHFIDVGANIGQTLLKVKATSPELPYLGFEPNVISCSYLEELIVANDMVDSIVLPLALGERDIFQPLRFRNLDELTDSAASLRTDNRAESFFGRELMVKVMTGDEVIESLGIGPVAAIKIDVEGNEPSVLKGLSKTIQRERPHLIIEVLGPTANLNSNQRNVRYSIAQEIHDWAEHNLYEILNIDNSGNLIDVKDLTSFLVSGRTSNYLLSPMSGLGSNPKCY